MSVVLAPRVPQPIGPETFRLYIWNMKFRRYGVLTKGEKGVGIHDGALR